MARNKPKSPDNIYRICRLRGGFSSQKNASIAFDFVEQKSKKVATSEGSLKDYERGVQVPNPETVSLMADTYDTPELLWMHCAKSCPVGQRIIKTDSDIGEDDIFHTYFELAGSFDKVTEMERQLHVIIDDRTLEISEISKLQEILEVMDRITENARDLRIWANKQGIDLNKSS